MNGPFQLSPFEQFCGRLRRLRCRYLRPGKFDRLQHRRQPDNGSEYSCQPFDRHRCIFVHIPKCAGISICKSLFGNLAGAHHSIRDYQLMFSPKEFAGYFKFAFVRNPWDRLVSAYLYLQDGGRTDNDRKWARETLGRFKGFDDFVMNGLTEKQVLKALHFRPQTQFICLRTNRPAVDFIGRFENLTEDFARVAQRLGIDTSLQQLNRTASKQRDFREYYTDATRRQVAEIYADDIRLLGYTFEPLAATPNLSRPEDFALASDDKS